MWEPRRLATLWAFTTCYRDSFTFYVVIQYRLLCGSLSLQLPPSLQLIVSKMLVCEALRRATVTFTHRQGCCLWLDVWDLSSMHLLCCCWLLTWSTEAHGRIQRSPLVSRSPLMLSRKFPFSVCNYLSLVYYMYVQVKSKQAMYNPSVYSVNTVE
jgi:hypothetical protein